VAVVFGNPFVFRVKRPMNQQNLPKATESELFELLIENVKDYAIFIVDPQNRVRSWNPGAQRLLGYAEEEIIGQSASRFFTEEDIADEVPQREMARALETGRGEGDRWHLRKDGSRFWAGGTITPLRDEERKLWGFAKIMRDRTLLKRHEDALKESLAYAEAVVETVRKPLLVLGADLRVKTANHAFYHTFRVSAHDTEGRLIYHLGDHQWDIPQLRTLLEDVLPANTSFEGFEMEHQFGVVGRKVLLLNARRLRHEDEGTDLILLAIEDITQRKRAEEERLQIETRFTSLVKNIKEHAIFTMDVRGHITSWNVEAERILGYSEGEILGQSFSLISTPADIEAGAPGEELRIAVETGRAVDEKWHLRKGGEEFWALGIVTPTYDAQGEHTGYSKILRDMTAQKLAVSDLKRAHQKAETKVQERTAELGRAKEGLRKEIVEQRRTKEGLRASEERYRRIVETTPDGIWTLDTEQRTTFVNAKMAEMLGYTVDEMMDRSLFDFMDEEAKPIAVASLERGKNWTEEQLDFKFRRKDGSALWSTVSSAAIMESGRYDGSLAIVTDITQRNALEQQLRQAQKMEAFGQLAGGVAHDFNNLLTIILGYSELQLESLPPDDANRVLIEAIRDAGGRAALLTRQLLAFCRKQIVQPQVLALNTVVTSAEQMLGRLIGEDMNLTTVLSPGLDRVKVDPGQLEQVIMNLVVNARDAMPQGGKITIETANVDLDESFSQSHSEVKPGRYVLLAVSDTGCGMSEEVKQRIFEPFFTTKDIGKGTGLGLATVFGIVKQSGGHVGVYSEVGHGTTFKIYLPSVDEIVPELQKTTVTDTTGTETILVVEDDAALRTMVRLTLQGKGYTLLEAPGGEEAIGLCESHEGPIHLLISDVVMPSMGGQQLGEQIKARRPETRILFVSGYTDDAVVRHGVLQAKVHFLQKPFTLDALSRKVRALLDMPASTRR